MTAWGYRRKKGSKEKFGNKRVEHAGRSFASKGEAGLFDYLKLLEKAGELRFEQAQDHVKLTDAGVTYIADYKIFDLKKQAPAWCEYKGFETPEWKIKKRLWAHYGPGELRIYKGYGTGLKLVETITPQLEKGGHHEHKEKDDQES